MSRRRVVSAPPSTGSAAFVENLKALIDVFGSLQAEAVAVRGERLALMRGHLAAPDGFEQFLLLLFEADSDGRVVAQTTFDEDDLMSALDELEARYCAAAGAEHEQSPEIENAVSRSVHAVLALCAAGGVDAVEAAGDRFAAPDIERFDRRRGVSAPNLHGREAFDNSVRAIYEVFGSIVAETIAIRGERLALMRVRYAAPGGFEQAMLMVYEANEAGLQARLVSFDDDDLTAAFDELEDRYCQGEGAEHELVIRVLGDGNRAFARRDWSAWERLFSADLVARDHRTLGFPLSDRASFLAMSQSLVEVAPDVLRFFQTLEVRRDAALGYAKNRGASADGNRYEWELWVVFRIVAGETVEVELFDVDDEVAARARFDAWSNET